MNLSQRNRNIILWLIAIGLLVSMVISFTPGTLFGGAAQRDAQQGPVVLNVNGQPIRELEVARLEQNPPFNAVQEGPAAEDLELVLLDQLVTQTLLQQAAADQNVSSADVRARVNEFREEQGVAGSRNDRAYLNLIAGAGYTDESFRELIRQQLQQERYLESLTGEVTVSDEEVETYFAANRDLYQSEPRITARSLVVDDEEEALLLYAQALAGEDFAALARENSTERAEQGGALGAAEGENTPQPVTRVALPGPVADAAFALQGPGLTTPIEAGGAYHIVKVESFEPAGPRPLDEVRDEVQSDVRELKEAAAQEAALQELREDAEISTPEGSSYSYDNPVVARVGEAEIREVELNRNTYLNPQIQQLLNPEFADIIASSVKPSVLDQLIDEELAYQGAQTLDVNFVGPQTAVAQSALGYVSRDVTVTDEQLRRYYEENEARFTEDPSAVTTRVNFAERESARNFREALLGSDTLSDEAIALAADAAGGTVADLGTVTPGTLGAAIDEALFNFDEGMTELGDGELEISEVLSVNVPAEAPMTGGAMTGGAMTGGAMTGGAMTGGAMTGGAMTGGAGAAPPEREQFVVLIAARTPPRLRPLSEVRAVVEQAVTQEQQAEAQREWLDEQRSAFPVENLLAAQAAEAAPAPLTGGALTGGSAPLAPTPPGDDAD
jgi:parvulin-like peptidyl-prolyl isomerase